MGKKTILLAIIVIFIGILGVRALFHKGFYTSHDGEHQAIRLYHFDQALKDGQIPPRWAGTADNGYGYPLFIFSYQSPWFLGVPLLRLGFSLTDATKWVFIIGFVASGIIMAAWLREMWGIIPALTGAILYMFAPYRFSNIFVRASLGEATTFMFIPLIFWGLSKYGDEKQWEKGVLLFGIGLAGLILSHLMILIVFFIPIVFWAGLQVLNSTRRSESIKKITMGILLGLGLTAYYFVPALLERQYTAVPTILQTYYLDHFVTIGQLIYSKWGYGFDFPGVAKDEMSFQIGIAQWLSVISLSALAAATSLKKKKIDKTAIFAIFFFIFSVLMMLPVTKPIWEQITKFAFFDFPWRFLSLSVFVGSLAAALLVKKLNKIGWLLAIILVAVALYTNRNHLRVNLYLYHDDSFYINNFQTTNMFDEYRPKTLNPNYLEKKRERFEIDKEKIKIKSETSRSNDLFVKGEAQEDSTARINIAFYPGWKVWLNGKEQSNILDGNGVMEIKIPKGNFITPVKTREVEFILEAKFTNTLIRTTANFISFMSILSLMIFILIRRSFRTI